MRAREGGRRRGEAWPGGEGLGVMRGDLDADGVVAAVDEDFFAGDA